MQQRPAVHQDVGLTQLERNMTSLADTDRKKLSKRTGDTALQDYRDKGFPKEAVVNFLCLQGWALNGTTEIFSVAV